MKAITTLLILSFFLTSGILQAQSQREVRNLGTFNTVKVSNAIKVELVKGNENKAELTVSGIDLGKVETSIVDETLEIRLARGNFRNHNVEVKVIYKDIQGIEALTSARVISKDFIKATEAYLFASTSAYLDAEVEADVLNIEAATNAKIFITGKVDSLGLKAFTNAEIDGQNLRANQVDVLANTAATVYFRTSGIIEGSVATAAKIYFKGNPKEISVKSSTSGTISRH